MTVDDILKRLPVSCAAGQAATSAEITGGYASDLLSNVMGQARAKNVWVTMQAHKNIVAVASLAGLSAVIIAGGSKPEPETLAKAESEQLPLLLTELSVFEVVGQLYAMGVKGI